MEGVAGALEVVEAVEAVEAAAAAVAAVGASREDLGTREVAIWTRLASGPRKPMTTIG